MSTPRRRAAALIAGTISLLFAATLGAGPAAAAAQGAKGSGGPDRPLVIGHRGASGYRPEHTLASYALAARMGADYVEPDLVSTRDGVLVARHENEIGGTTNVADKPQFAGRATFKVVDGVRVPTTGLGWFTEDFTLAELKTLRAKERIPDIRPRNTLYNGRYEIPTLQEVIDLTQRLSEELGREIGIYPETKHPTYFRDLGLALEGPLVRTLRRNGLDGADAKVFVQSFEVRNLKRLDRRIDAPLVQLLPIYTPVGDRVPEDPTTPAGLEAIAEYADGVGPAKTLIVPRDAAGNSLAPTSFVKYAQDAGLQVHPYTFRNENTFLPLELRVGADPAQYGKAFDEYAQFFALGVDGVFSDNPDTAVAARDEDVD